MTLVAYENSRWWYSRQHLAAKVLLNSLGVPVLGPVDHDDRLFFGYLHMQNLYMPAAEHIAIIRVPTDLRFAMNRAPSDRRECATRLLPAVLFEASDLTPVEAARGSHGLRLCVGAAD